MDNLPTVQTNEFQPVVEQDSLMATEAMKGVAEVHGAIMMAKKYPRDQFTAFNNIMKACERKSLAESAVYAYPRGGQTVSGASIRLAEAIAQVWGNISYGIRELSRDEHKSSCCSYAWDLETNTRAERFFEVEHKRVTKERSYKLTDPRDIYENMANYGARRLRACILEIIPADITESAVNACKKTLTSGKEPIIDRLRKMIVEFDKLGVKQTHIEKRLGHGIDATTADEIFDLLTVFNSLKDGHGKRSDYFDIAETEPTEKAKDLQEKLKKAGS